MTSSCMKINCQNPTRAFNDFCALHEPTPLGVTEEYTGGSVSYYQVSVKDPVNTSLVGYVAECSDIIEALNMSFAEGNAFKAIWRSCAARSLGLKKKGYTDGLYDAEKVVFYGERMVIMAERLAETLLENPTPLQPN
jgi:hypothetical protein